MKNKSKHRYQADDELQFQSEIDAIASMTQDEVHAELRRFGMEPITVLPQELKRLLTTEPLNVSPVCGELCLPSATKTFIFLPFRMERLIPTITVALLLWIIVISGFVLFNSRAVKAGSASVPTEGNIGRAIPPSGQSISPLEQFSATRVWISGAGNDANKCSRNAPCKTFWRAVWEKAAGGEIIVLDPTGFYVVAVYSISDS